MYQLEAEMILKYIEEYLPMIESTFQKEAVKERSYSRWAAYEVVERLMDHPFDPPQTIVDAFLLELLYYSNMSKSEQQKSMWTTAIDTLEDISCLLD